MQAEEPLPSSDEPRVPGLDETGREMEPGTVLEDLK
jgi:hypothetical protein